MKITSKNNPHIKWIRGLRRRKERTGSGLFVVEGIRWVLAALAQPDRVQAVFYCPETLTSPLGWQAVARAQNHVPVYAVSAEVMESVSSRDHPVGLLAVVAQRWTALDEAAPGLWVALNAVQYPGNLGTILRTADAVGATGVILLDDATDPYHPDSVRASLGTVLSQRLVRTDTASFARWKAAPVIGADDGAVHLYRRVRYPLPLVLLLGAEGGGLTGPQRALCDDLVRIPMVGGGDSLNLAVASAVILYEILAQHESAFRA